MQAFVINKPGSCSLTTDLSKPQICPDEVLVKIKKVGFAAAISTPFVG